MAALESIINEIHFTAFDHTLTHTHSVVCGSVADSRLLERLSERSLERLARFERWLEKLEHTIQLRTKKIDFERVGI